MKNGARRVVITGVGAVTPIGTGADGLWAGLVDQRLGIGPRINRPFGDAATSIGGSASISSAGGQRQRP